MSWDVKHSVYLDENPKVVALRDQPNGDDGELLFFWLLRLCRRQGFEFYVPAAYASARFLARQRAWSEDRTACAVEALVTAEMLVRGPDGGLEIVADDHWEQVADEAKRKREERARKKSGTSAASDTSGHVTDGHGRSRTRSDASGHVTDGHDASKARPDSHAPDRSDPIRTDPNLPKPLLGASDASDAPDGQELVTREEAAATAAQLVEKLGGSKRKRAASPPPPAPLRVVPDDTDARAGPDDS